MDILAISRILGGYIHCRSTKKPFLVYWGEMRVSDSGFDMIQDFLKR